MLDKKAAEANRISTRGGVDPFWIDNDTLLYASAGDYSVDNIAAPRNERRPLEISLPRDTGKGRLALTNARLLTLGPAGTILRGDLIVNDGRIVCVGKCDRRSGDHVIDFPARQSFRA